MLAILRLLLIGRATNFSWVALMRGGDPLRARAHWSDASSAASTATCGCEWCASLEICAKTTQPRRPAPNYTWPIASTRIANDPHIVVRAQGDVSAAARKTIAQIDPGIPVKVGTLNLVHSGAVALPRFRTHC